MSAIDRMDKLSIAGIVIMNLTTSSAASERRGGRQSDPKGLPLPAGEIASLNCHVHGVLSPNAIGVRSELRRISHGLGLCRDR